MKDSSQLICSITAFLFLALFVSIEYLPATWVLQLYIILTSKITVFEMIGFIPVAIFYSIKDKDFGISLLLIIFMTGQTMFVHVYADKYTIATTQQNEKPVKMKSYYYPNWNKA